MCFGTLDVKLLAVGFPLSSVHWISVLILVGAAGLWIVGMRTLAGLTALAACCWPGTRLIAEAAGAAAFGLVGGALWEPVVAVFAVTALASARQPIVHVPIFVAAALMLVLGLTRALVYEPFRDPSCPASCVRSPILVRADLDAARTVVLFSAAIGALLWMTIVTVALLRGLRTAGWTRAVSVIMGALAVVLTTRALFTLVTRPVPMPEFLPRRLAALGRVSGALVGVAALAMVTERSVMWHRVRGVSRLLAEDARPGTSQAQLVGALGDREVVVGHWIDAMGFVDSTGRLMNGPPAGRRWTELTSRDHPIAVVEHSASVAPEVLERRLGSSVRIAIQNESLRLQLERHIDELAMSRRRVVETAEAEQLRLERDLHDGAQQRVLALSFELRRGTRHADQLGDTTLSRAFSDTNTVALSLLAQLRDLAHGIHPAVLDSAGLAAALRHFVDHSPVPLDVDLDELGPLPKHVQRAIYAVVRDSAQAQGTAHSDRVTVTTDGSVVRVTVHGVRRPHDSLIDRLDAVGGRHRLVDGTLEVELSCV
jgi:signal transduction histidine kinase